MGAANLDVIKIRKKWKFHSTFSPVENFDPKQNFISITQETWFFEKPNQVTIISFSRSVNSRFIKHQLVNKFRKFSDFLSTLLCLILLFSKFFGQFSKKFQSYVPTIPLWRAMMKLNLRECKRSASIGVLTEESKSVFKLFVSLLSVQIIEHVVFASESDM